jgi:hypothetical protein
VKISVRIETAESAEERRGTRRRRKIIDGKIMGRKSVEILNAEGMVATSGSNEDEDDREGGSW